MPPKGGKIACMIRVVVIILSLLASQTVNAHRGHTSFVHVTNDGDKLMVKAKLAIPDLEVALSDQSCSDSNRLPFCVEAYLTDHFHLVIDGTFVPLYLESSTEKDGYLIMYMSADSVPSCNHSISVTNTCFVGVVDHYHNKLEIRWNGESKQYNMNQNRKSITYNLP